MNSSIGHALVLGLLVLAPALVAPSLNAQPVPRQPRGIYAVVRVEMYVTQQLQAKPSITQAQLDAFFDSYYQGLLADPAVSGLTLLV